MEMIVTGKRMDEYLQIVRVELTYRNIDDGFGDKIKFEILMTLEESKKYELYNSVKLNVSKVE